MASALRIGIALLVVGLALVAIPLYAIGPPEPATYYLETNVVNESAVDDSVVALEDVNGSVRSDVRRAVRSTDAVDAGTNLPDVPEYVRDDGDVYRIGVIVADPGEGAAVLSFGLLASGVITVGVGALALGVAAWRRVR